MEWWPGANNNGDDDGAGPGPCVPSASANKESSVVVVVFYMSVPAEVSERNVMMGFQLISRMSF